MAPGTLVYVDPERFALAAYPRGVVGRVLESTERAALVELVDDPPTGGRGRFWVAL